MARAPSRVLVRLKATQLYRRFNTKFVGSSLMIRFAGDARPDGGSGPKRSARGGSRESIALPKRSAQSMHEQQKDLLVPVRLILLLGIVAMMIAVIELYGVVALAVSRAARRRWASAWPWARPENDIIGLLLRSGFKPVLGVSCWAIVRRRWISCAGASLGRPSNHV